MSWNLMMEPQTSKKIHRCTWCGEPIMSGQVYWRWMSIDAGDPFTNKMHTECKDLHAEESNFFCDGEYQPYINDRPNA